VAPWVGQRRWGVVLGQPYLATVGFGNSTTLGPYLSASARLPIPGAVGIGVGAALYYPPLDPLVRELRPFAERLQRKQRALYNVLSQKFKPLRKGVKARRKLGRRQRDPDSTQ
jgi:hypothetical protein